MQDKSRESYLEGKRGAPGKGKERGGKPTQMQFQVKRGKK